MRVNQFCLPSWQHSYKEEKKGRMAKISMKGAGVKLFKKAIIIAVIFTLSDNLRKIKLNGWIFFLNLPQHHRPIIRPQLSKNQQTQ